VLLIGILHLLADEDGPYEIVQRIVDWLPSGSYLALSTPTADFDGPLMEALAEIGRRAGLLFFPRSRSELEAFFVGLDLVPPGVVPMLGWKPDVESDDVKAVHGWIGVARKR
jgi:hypothetical protein